MGTSSPFLFGQAFPSNQEPGRLNSGLHEKNEKGDQTRVWPWLLATWVLGLLLKMNSPPYFTPAYFDFIFWEKQSSHFFNGNLCAKINRKKLLLIISP